MKMLICLLFHMILGSWLLPIKNSRKISRSDVNPDMKITKNLCLSHAKINAKLNSNNFFSGSKGKFSEF